MQKDERDLLEVLKFELQFLQDGGYGRSPKAQWRPLYIFEDSPTCCLNYDSKDHPSPCTDCVLLHLVPPELRSSKIPCRHIPLDTANETLDSLYRYSDQQQIEEIVSGWLRRTIHRLEQERRAARRDPGQPATRNGEGMKGTPLYQRQQPKCANPACPTAFHWTGGGKFFRFRPDGASTNRQPTSESRAGVHGVRHYWLCERCSHVFTLVYDEEYGVVLKALWPEIPVPEEHREMSAT